MSEEKELKRRASLIRAYRTTFTSRSGKIVLRDLMQVHYMLNSSFTPGDPHETAFKEGERNVVVRILQQMNINPNDLLKEIDDIVKENTDVPYDPI